MKESLCFDSPVIQLPGVGTVRAAALEKMGIHTLRDLLYYFPRAYENRGNIRRLSEGTDGAKSAFCLTVGTQPRTIRLRNRLTMTKFRAFDESGSVDIVFYNQDYVKNVFTVGAVYRFFGSIHFTKNVACLASPAYESYVPGKDLPDYISVYSLSSGVSRKVIEGLITTALSVPIPDFLPEEIRLRQHLPTLSLALHMIHRPETQDMADAAMRRLVFDELFCMSAAVAANRIREEIPTGAPCRPIDFSSLLSLLPYSLTGAQMRVLHELHADMTSGANAPSMRRILIGDVGSGKTICAFAAIYLAVRNGYQAVLMAPTEILANQHYADMCPTFAALGIQVRLLTGATSVKEKKSILTSLAASENPLPVLIGTHALLSDNVRFSNLGLTVTDEQQRFGILQRTALGKKAVNSHLLVMSATPIPRTLALALYGDLHISMLDEMPPGRQIVDTFTVDESYRARLNAFIARQVADGGQVYIVCPAVEEAVSEEEDGGDGEILLNSLHPSPRRADLKSAVAYAANLRERIFPDLTVGLLHGRMKPAEKEAVMNSFVGGDIDILVATTVIEVGVNVPNACLMVVENAENFGLSQLHQLRGRVGRGNRKSYCILVSEFTRGTAAERLRVMTATSNGYEIAERDLALRGPGDFFSGAVDSEMRQSGGIGFRLAGCCDDPQLMDAAFTEAGAFVREHPALCDETSAPVRTEINRYFRKTDNDVS